MNQAITRTSWKCTSIIVMNVVYMIYIIGYGFSLSDFANIWSYKLSLPVTELKAKLFTDSYLSKGVIKADADRLGKKTLFEQLVLQPLWEVHKCALVDEAFDKLKVIFSFLILRIIVTSSDLKHTIAPD